MTPVNEALRQNVTYSKYTYKPHCFLFQANDVVEASAYVFWTTSKSHSVTDVLTIFVLRCDSNMTVTSAAENCRHELIIMHLYK